MWNNLHHCIFFIWHRKKKPYPHLTLGSQKLSHNSLNTKLNPICHLLAFLGTHPILHISRIRVNPTGTSPKFCTLWCGHTQDKHLTVDLMFMDPCIIVQLITK
jgi:hypothetical protein